MYSSSETNQYQKYENPPTTDQFSKYSAPPPPSQFSHQDQEASATGIPVTSTSQFATLQVESQPLVPWSTGLCDCFSDIRTCCITLWCPCITFGQIAEIIDRGASSCGMNGALYTLIMCVTGCTCLYSCFYRSKLRSQYHLEGSPCLDCLVHCCCESCALCQEYRELKIRGFDISIGWHGNVEKQSRGITTLPPAIAAGMSRQ